MTTDNLIGITERGDPAFDLNWIPWVSKGRPAIIISKNPVAICKYLAQMNDINVIVHVTITGYGGTDLEPGVIKSEAAFDGYLRLIGLLGHNRVVLRVDPIIPTAAGHWVAEQLIKQAITRVRISFLDMYDHVRERFIREDMDVLKYGFHAPLVLRHKIWSELGRPEICGEPDLPSTGCISDLDCQILGVSPIDILFKQRTTCACKGNKRELLSSQKQCKHGCLYCYWKN